MSAGNPAPNSNVDKGGFKVSHDRPSIKLTQKGWVLSWNNKSVTIMDDILGLKNPETIKESLNLPSPAEAWKLKTLALSEWWPEDLDEFRNLFPTVVGEDENVKLMGLAILTIKLRNPKERVWGALLEAANSAGKSNLAEAFLAPFRLINLVEEFTRVTEAFYERQGSIDRKILYLQEVRNAPAAIHISMSEGLVRVGLVDRDESGRLKPTELLLHGTPFLVATTTNWRGNADLLHRTIKITLDESAQQTYRIAEFKARLDMDFEFKRAFERFTKGCQKILVRLWKALPENIDVIIPFFDLIVEKLRQELGENVDVKLRRDIVKLAAFIKGHAILSINKRPRFKTKLEDGQETTVIVATPEDFEAVLPLLRSAFKATIAGISEKEIKVLEALEEIEKSKQEGPIFATYRELAKMTGIPSSTIRLIMIPRLENLGLVIVDRETRPHQIERTRRAITEVGLTFSEEERKLMAERVEEVVNRLLSRGYATTHEKIRLEIGKTEEIEAGERVVTPTTQGEGVILEKERGEAVSEKSSKSSLGVETILVAIPLKSGGHRFGRLLLEPLEFEIELNDDVIPLLGGDRYNKLLDDLKALYGAENVTVDGSRIHVNKNISGEQVTFLVDRLARIFQVSLKKKEVQESRKVEAGKGRKPKAKPTKTKIAFLCEDCFLTKKREGKIVETRGKPAGLEVCENCGRSLAEYVVILEDEGGGEDE